MMDKRIRRSEWWNREVESTITGKRRLYQLWLLSEDGYTNE